jgi:hypothetical protein
MAEVNEAPQRIVHVLRYFGTEPAGSGKSNRRGRSENNSDGMWPATYGVQQVDAQVIRSTFPKGSRYPVVGYQATGSFKKTPDQERPGF